MAEEGDSRTLTDLLVSQVLKLPLPTIEESIVFGIFKCSIFLLSFVMHCITPYYCSQHCVALYCTVMYCTTLSLSFILYINHSFSPSINLTLFNIHTYIHTYIHTHIHTYIHTYIHTNTHLFFFLTSCIDTLSSLIHILFWSLRSSLLV